MVCGRRPGDLSTGERKCFHGKCSGWKAQVVFWPRLCRLLELEDICGGQFFEGLQSEDAEEFRRGAVGDI